MKLRAAILSMVTLGLCTVPVFSHAQGVGSSATFSMSDLLPNVPLQSGSLSAITLPSVGSTTLSPGLNLPSSSSSRNAASGRALPGAGSPLSPSMNLTSGGVKTIDGSTPNAQGSTKFIQSFGSGSAGKPGTVHSNDFGAAATPEPGAMAMIIGGVSSSLVVLRRRRKK